MAHQIYDVAYGWSATARYTASGETEVLISNLAISPWWRMGWTVTSDDTIPAEDPRKANPIQPGTGQPFTLADGERFWLTMVSPNTAAPGRVQM